MLGSFKQLQVDPTKVGYYIAVFAVGNFIGPLVLGPLFDTVGRVKMIAGTYILSGVLLATTGFMLGSLTGTTLTMMGAITFFYAIGTAAGGIAGPLLFGALIENAVPTQDLSLINIGYVIGAILMIAGGLVELALGVKAEPQTLENIAKPLTAESKPKQELAAASSTRSG